MIEWSSLTSFPTTTPPDPVTRWPEVNPNGEPESCHSAMGCCGARRIAVAATGEDAGVRVAVDGARDISPVVWVQPLTQAMVMSAADVARRMWKGGQRSVVSAMHVRESRFLNLAPALAMPA